jgi:hypothetical protein
MCKESPREKNTKSKQTERGEIEHKTSVIVRDAGDHEKKKLRLRRSSSWH